MADKKKTKSVFLLAMKDIPKCFKGFPTEFITKLRDLATKPVESFDGLATRKKEVLSFLYVFIAAFIAIDVLGTIISKVPLPLLNILVTFALGIIGLVILAGVVYCLYLLNVLRNAQKQFKDLECQNCKSMIAYDTNVKILSETSKIDIRRLNQKGWGSNYGKNIRVVGKKYTSVRILCKCQGCGTEKEFSHNFVTAKCERSDAHLPNGAYGPRLVQLEQDIRRELENDRGISVDTVVRNYFAGKLQLRQ